MSSSTKWREEQVLVICPGSSTTMAQLGCNELTPPSQRFPTRMFKDEETGQWRPYYTYKRKRTTATDPTAGAYTGVTGASDGEAKREEEEDEYDTIEDPDSDEGAVYPIQGGRIVHMDAFLAFLDHVHSMLTTTYHNTPIVLMASPQWTRPHCEAIARYIFEKTRTPALCLIHSGVATQYGLRWPNMTVVDIGYEKVDVTCIHENRVVSHRDVRDAANEGAISGGEVFTRRLWQLLRDKEDGFSHDMAEQLKKSQICEVLPYAADQPDLVELPTASAAQPPPAAGSGGPSSASATAGASTTASASAPAPPPAAAAASGTTIGDAPATLDAEDGEDKTADNDGVLDIANIVTSGQTKEFLAKKEKEKAEKAKAGKKGKGPEAADANKPTRLPNSKRIKNTFHYEEIIQVEPAAPAPKVNGAPAQEAHEENMTADKNEQSAAQSADQPAVQPAVGDEAKPVAEAAKEENPEEEKPKEEQQQEEKPQEEEPQKAKPQEEKASEGEQQQQQLPPPAPEPQPSNDALKIDNFLPPPETTTAPMVPTEPQARRVRRDIEVGLERFTFADRKEIDRIAAAIYDAVQNIGEMYMRPACWDNLVFVGNGSRIRGLKDNIVQTLTSRYLISPSSATMFTSELPSNIATPSGTGSQTPTGNFSGPPHTMPLGAGPSSGVNPLLQAATTASLQQAQQQQQGLPQHPGVMTPGGMAGSQSGEPMPSHHFHSQTPTSIKTAPMPTYLAEWTKHGFEEAMFLGSLVAARLAFCVHNMDAHGLEAQRLMSLNRVDYNELGPKGVRTHSMLG